MKILNERQADAVLMIGSKVESIRQGALHVLAMPGELPRDLKPRDILRMAEDVLALAQAVQTWRTLYAYAHQDLSEGQVARVLSADRLAVRLLEERAVSWSAAVGASAPQPPPPLHPVLPADD